MILRHSISFALALTLLACSNNPEENVKKENNSNIPVLQTETNNLDTNSTIPSSMIDIYTSETFETTGQKGWGYRIMLNGELYINQPHIPAVQGNKGFSNPMFAKKTADYAISKIEQGIVPPTLTVDELDSLGVLK